MPFHKLGHLLDTGVDVGGALIRTHDMEQSTGHLASTRKKARKVEPGIVDDIMGVLGSQNESLMRGSDDIAKDPEKMQNLLDMVAMMSAPVPGVGVATGLGADVFRSQHSGMNGISAGASALPVGIAVGKALGGAPAGALMSSMSRFAPGLSTVQASSDDLARAAMAAEKMEGKLSNAKQLAEETGVLGALAQSAPKAAKLLTEYKAIPESDHIARAAKLKEVTGALFQGVKPGFHPAGGGIASMFGHAPPSIPINKLVQP